jgi:RimJ/RimL family protein N-acetyltransferase
MPTIASAREIRTERLLLRPFQPDDVAAIGRYASHDEYTRFLSPHHLAPAEFVAHNVGNDWRVERSWIISLEGEVVGSVFLGINSDDRAAELSCLIAPEFWGREIAVEALGAAIDQAFGELDLVKVAARADPRHEAAIRVMGKLGMRNAGLVRSDQVIYELERPDSHVDV